ncbi:TetR family transcriptional regulator, partial [Streptomyces viridosporus]
WPAPPLRAEHNTRNRPDGQRGAPPPTEVPGGTDLARFFATGPGLGRPAPALRPEPGAQSK